MILINLGNGKPWSLFCSFNIMVDFCVWVLEIDGLQVPPFSRHSDGNGMLRARGMDSESWRAWIEKTVLLLDQRLNWRVEEPQAKMAETLASFERMTSISSTDNPTPGFSSSSSEPVLHASIEQQMAWQDQQYWDAVSAVQQAYGEFVPLTVRDGEPADMWEGEPAVRECLKELWQRYTAAQQGHDSKWHRREAERIAVPIDELWDSLHPYRSRLAALHLYQVAYPEPVAYLVPPVSAILSVSAGASDNDSVFRQQVLNAAESLVSNGTI